MVVWIGEVCGERRMSEGLAVEREKIYNPNPHYGGASFLGGGVDWRGMRRSRGGVILTRTMGEGVSRGGAMVVWVKRCGGRKEEI